MGAAGAHVFVTWANRAAKADQWLKGPYGPPFFNVALFYMLLYGAIGAALSRGPRGAAIGAAGPFLMFALPMALLTRAVEQSSQTWMWAVTTLFVLSIWSTIFALGFWIGPRVRGALGAVGGALGAYAVIMMILAVAPELKRGNPLSSVPPPNILLDGLLTGCGMAAGIHYLGGFSNEKTNRSRA
jgi:hypothetical protein